MRFIEETESAWSVEQLKAAEQEIEKNKLEWEQNQLAAMREEEERRARELEEENELLTFSREDATNQVSNKTNKKLIKNKKLVNKMKNKKQKRKLLLRNRTVGGCGGGGGGNKRRTRLFTRKKRIIKKAKIEKPIVKEEEEEEVPVKEELIEDNSQDDNNLNVLPKVNGDTENEEDSVDSQAESNSTVSSTKTCHINYVDHNSPRTRSRGSVAINLWTLDVSPILPGVKPVKNSPLASNTNKRNTRSHDKDNDDSITTTTTTTKKNNKRNKISEDDKSQSDEEEDVKKIPFKRKRTKTNSISSSSTTITTVENDVDDNREEKKGIIDKSKECKVMLNDIMADGQFKMTADDSNSMHNTESNSNSADGVMENKTAASLNDQQSDDDGDCKKMSESEDEIVLAKLFSDQSSIEKDDISKEDDDDDNDGDGKEENLEKNSSHLDNGINENHTENDEIVKMKLKTPSTPPLSDSRKKIKLNLSNNKTLDKWLLRGSSSTGKSLNVNNKKIVNNLNDENEKDLELSDNNTNSVRDVNNGDNLTQLTKRTIDNNDE